jgi:hypothetical protein
MFFLILTCSSSSKKLKGDKLFPKGQVISGTLNVLCILHRVFQLDFCEIIQYFSKNTYSDILRYFTKYKRPTPYSYLEITKLKNDIFLSTSYLFPLQRNSPFSLHDFQSWAVIYSWVLNVAKQICGI